MVFRTLALLFSALAGMVVVADNATAQQRTREPAQLGFRVCNQTSNEIDVAKALNTGTSDGRGPIIISEGWYKLAGGSCLFLWPGRLEYQYYLVYAQNRVTHREWAGNIPVCVGRDAFSIRSDTCGEQYHRRMFIDVNTGDEKSLFTYYFRQGSQRDGTPNTSTGANTGGGRARKRQYAGRVSTGPRLPPLHENR